MSPLGICLFYEVDAKADAGMYEIDETNKTSLAFFLPSKCFASLRFASIFPRFLYSLNMTIPPSHSLNSPTFARPTSLNPNLV